MIPRFRYHSVGGFILVAPFDPDSTGFSLYAPLGVWNDGTDEGPSRKLCVTLTKA